MAEQEASDWKQKATECYRAHRYEALHTLLRQVLARDPETVEVYLFIGDMFFDGELYELAIRFYKQARSDHPHCVEAYLREGDAYTRLGRFVLAAERYTLALARSPRLTLPGWGKAQRSTWLGDLPRHCKPIGPCKRMPPILPRSMLDRDWLSRG